MFHYKASRGEVSKDAEPQPPAAAATSTSDSPLEVLALQSADLAQSVE